MNDWEVSIDVFGTGVVTLTVRADNEDDALFRAGYVAALGGSSGDFSAGLNPIFAQVLDGVKVVDSYEA